MAVAERTSVSVTARGSAERPLEIVFVLRALTMLRYFQSTLELLVERGHTLRLALEEPDRSPTEQAWLDRMLEHQNFTSEPIKDLKRDVWHRRATTAEAALEYLTYLDPAYSDRPRYLKRALRRSPP